MQRQVKRGSESRGIMQRQVKRGSSKLNRSQVCMSCCRDSIRPRPTICSRLFLSFCWYRAFGSTIIY